MSSNSRTSAGLHRRKNLDERLSHPVLQAIGDEDSCSRAVAHRTAIIQLQRIADEGRLIDRLLGQVRAHLRQGIGQTVALVLTDYSRQFTTARAVATAIDARDQTEKARKREPARPVRSIIHRAVERPGNISGIGMHHLLAADGERDVAQPHCDRQIGVTEGDTARRTRPLDLRTGNLGQAKLIGD